MQRCPARALAERSEVLELEIGGGGLSLAEGATADDFPDAVSEHCPASELWFAASPALVVHEVP